MATPETVLPGQPAVIATANPAAAAAASFNAAIAGPTRKPQTTHTIAWVLAAWLTVMGNLALWRELARLGGAPSLYAPSVLTMGALVFFGTLALLGLAAWSRWIKPVSLAVVLVAALVQHYMLAYRTVIDPTMIANVLQTDTAEARDLLNWRLLADLLLVTLPPVLWLWKLPVIRLRWQTQAWTNTLLVAGALVAMTASGFASYRHLAPLMRNNPQLRYMMNPLAALYSAGRVALKPAPGRGKPLVLISGGAALGATYAGAATRPPLLLLVVGETARADHFALNGYGRDTTPALAARDVLSWHNAQSCGTNTAASVPCMFSHLGKRGFEARDGEYENLLDVINAAGLAVLWVDNQAGCKGVCDRVPHASTRDAVATPAGQAFCEGDECLDEMLLAGLDARIAALPAERRARGVVVVMHQMGSHGPAYFKRSSAALKRFVPECRTTELAQCGHAELVNGFDNSIAYTDHVLGRAIDWLKGQSAQRQTAMLYMSDHGESLGEFGIYLHGMPYGFAPEAQKHVPLVLWPGTLAARTGVDTNCLRRQLDAAVSHDNLYATVLGLLDVKTPTYQRALDAFAPCRPPA